MYKCGDLLQLSNCQGYHLLVGVNFPSPLLLGGVEPLLDADFQSYDLLTFGVADFELLRYEIHPHGRRDLGTEHFL